MRSSQSFVVALLVGIFGLAPLNAVAQGGFLVLSTKETAETPAVHVVNCTAVKQGNWNCTIKADAKKCEPGQCSFHQRAAADRPGILMYGVSSSETCTWVYDGQNYYPYCWR